MRHRELRFFRRLLESRRNEILFEAGRAVGSMNGQGKEGYPDPKTKPVRGYIGLQDSHSAAGHYIEFRNIRVKEVKRSG